MSRGLSGRTIVVTGAARGMGKAIAERIALEGARLVAIDILGLDETRERVECVGAQPLCIRADLTSEADIADAHAAIKAQWGGADGLVNVAGIMPVRTWQDTDYAFWKKVQTVNVDSMFFTCKQFVPDMQAKKSGRIVNFSSGIIFANVPDRIAYRTSKAAIMGFTRGLAIELAEHNITVNSVTPSIVATEGAAIGTEDRGNFVPPSQLLKRPQQPEDIAGLVAFLMSDDAAFITGQMIHADGGLIMR